MGDEYDQTTLYEIPKELKKIEKKCAKSREERYWEWRQRNETKNMNWLNSNQNAFVHVQRI